jgi:hypothetical protein
MRFQKTGVTAPETARSQPTLFMTIRCEIAGSPCEVHGAKNNAVRGATKKERHENRGQACRSGECAIAAEAAMNNVG